MHTMFSAELHCFAKSRMIVAVEHCPDLVVFLKRFLCTAAVPSKPLGLGELHGFFRDGVGNTHTGTGFHDNERA